MSLLKLASWYIVSCSTDKNVRLLFEGLCQPDDGNARIEDRLSGSQRRYLEISKCKLIERFLRGWT
jgi:hypothetical protein